LSPELEERLTAAAADPALSPEALEALGPLMSALESAPSDAAQHVVDLKRGLVATLGETAAAALCDGAGSPAEVAHRFFRLRELLAEHALLGAPRAS
jgi:hypothetical protein